MYRFPLFTIVIEYVSSLSFKYEVNEILLIYFLVQKILSLPFIYSASTWKLTIIFHGTGSAVWGKHVRDAIAVVKM